MSTISKIAEFVQALWNANIYYINRIPEKLHSDYLSHVRKDGFRLSEDAFIHIKKCANEAYEDDSFFIYNEYQSADQLINNLNCGGSGQVYAITGDCWYMLIIKHLTHVVIYDFASASKKCSDFRLFTTFFRLFSGCRCKMQCRSSTSYPLIQSLERKKRIKIIKDEVVICNGEENHRLTIKIPSR